MAPDAYLDALVAMAKGEERSGMCRSGLERKGGQRHVVEKGSSFKGDFSWLGQ